MKSQEVPASAAGGINKTMSKCAPAKWRPNHRLTWLLDYDLEIRKRYGQPLAVESGEFPDVASIESKMLPFCYEAGLVDGHSSDAAQFVTVATEFYIKELLSSVLSRTRSNGPGDSSAVGFGSGRSWVQTHKYRRQLRREEEALMRGELTRDKSGLLPIEAKAASDRAPLGMADFRLALEIGDCGMASFPIVTKAITYGYRDGELEHWGDYSWIDDRKSTESADIEMGGVGSAKPQAPLTNGVVHPEPMDIDDWGWDGTDLADTQSLDNVLDSCLAVAS